MFSILSPEQLARASARMPWLIVGLWAVLVAAALVSARSIQFDEQQSITGSDSDKAQRLVEEVQGGEPVVETVVIEGLLATVDDAEYRSFVTELVQEIRRVPIVASANNYYETNAPYLISSDRTKMIIPVRLNVSSADAAKEVGALIDTLEEASSGSSAFVAITAGEGSIEHDRQESAEKDLKEGEMIGLPVALVVLFLVFGAAVAAGVPIVLGLLGIIVSVGLTALLSRLFGISSMTVTMISMIGLAVGIDYTLFIIERFREERARGVTKVDAIAVAGNTASRAVLFSGITVIIALTGLLIVPATVFKGMATGAIIVVAAAVLIALTLLPALLSILADRINWLRLPGHKHAVNHNDESGFWGRTTSVVMRHPVIAIVGCSALLLALAAPLVTMKLGSPGVSQLPQNLQSAQAFRVLDRDFSAGQIAPAQVAIEGDVDTPAVANAVEDLRSRIAKDAAFGPVSELRINDDGTVAVVSVIVGGDAFEQPAREAVERLRNDYVPSAFEGAGVDVYVGGTSAETTDFINTMTSYLPIVIAFILALSFVLLLMVFRSIVIPVKAIIMNLLSVGASYGLITLVFQHGVGADLLGFQQSDTIVAFLPIFLFAVLFGLSMDYHVFLLSRIQEQFLKTGQNAAAVGYGLRSTAQIITGAAAIMMAVFSGFALGDMVELQQTGFGLAIAVFLDATIVRSILVPASMEMLGAANWYFPRWLRWLPRISVEGGSSEAKPAMVPAPRVVQTPVA